MKQYWTRIPRDFPNSYGNRQTQQHFKISYNKIDDGLQDERCECGNLLFKIQNGEYVEIKCRRCRRLHIIPINKLTNEPGETEDYLYQEDLIANGNEDKTFKPEENRFVAYPGSNRFHRPECGWASRRKPEDRIFLSTREQAIKQGYKPCRKCKP
jgi:phage FluMu protein Com